MNDVFDPLYSWLGIPPSEKPADYYRLLGLSRFESNKEVITNAAERQMRHVRTFQLGENVGHSQAVLNELAEARACLLNSASKATYDQQLHAQISEQNPPPIASPIPASLLPTWRWVRSRPKNSIVEVVKILVGGIAGLTTVALLLWYGFGTDVLDVVEPLEERLSRRGTQGEKVVRPTLPPYEETRQDGTKETMPQEADVHDNQTAEPMLAQLEDSVHLVQTQEESIESHDAAIDSPPAAVPTDTPTASASMGTEALPALSALTVPHSLKDDVTIFLTFNNDTFVQSNGWDMVLDSGGHNNHGIVHGAEFTDDGRRGGGLYLDGIDDYVTFPTLREDLLKNLDAISICMWVKLNWDKRYHFLFDVGHAAPSSISLVARDQAILTFGLPVDFGGVTLDSQPIALDGWHHVAGTWDGKMQRLYHDGVLIAAAPTKDLALTSESVTRIAASLGIQAKDDIPLASPKNKRRLRFLKGTVDEFAIFSKALSADDLRELMGR